MNHTTILKPGGFIIMDGKKVTYEEIKEHTIDSILFRKRLKELMAAEEGGN